LDHGGEALIGFAGAHGDAFELFEFAEEVFNEVSPFVHLQIDFDRFGPLRHLRDHDFHAALVEFVDDPVGIISLVSKQCAHFDAFDEWCHAKRVPTVAGQQDKADKIA
jgi:hypothetical protein